MENGPFIDGLPINSMVIFYSYVSLPEGILINTGYATFLQSASLDFEEHPQSRNVHNRMVLSQEWVILNMIG